MLFRYPKGTAEYGKSRGEAALLEIVIWDHAHQNPETLGRD
jgi:hypothetical protein